MPELIELVNKTNSRLLYDDLVKSISKREASSDDADQYQLLNTFEMLWNVDKTQEAEEEKKSFKGHALTVKEEYLESDKLV